MITREVLRGRWRLALARFRSGRGGRRDGWRDMTLVLLLAILSWVALGRVFERLALERTSPADAALVLGLVLTAAAAGLVMFDLHHAVSTLVLDSDLALLRAAPLEPRALACLKFLDALPSTLVLTLVLVLPALIGFARAYPLPAWAWFVMVAAVVSSWLAPLALGMSVALPLVRRVPARHAREALAVFATTGLVLLWMTQAFVLPHWSERVDGFAGPLVGLAREWDRLRVVLPPFWLAHALGAAARVNGGEAVPGAVTLAWEVGGTMLLILLVSFALYLATATRQLEAVWESLAGSTAGPRASRPRSAGGGMPVAGGLTRAMLERDGRLIRRDWAVLVDVVAACALWMLLPLASLPLDRGMVPLAGPMLVSLAVGLGYETAARAAPFERGGLSWVRLAPVEPIHWLLARLAGIGAFSLAIVTLATGVIALTLHPAARVLIAGIIVTLSALAASLGLGVWTGLRYGDPGWLDPRGMLVTRGRLLASLGLLFQIGGWVTLLWLAQPPGDPGRPWLLAFAPVVGLAFGALGLALARRELGRDTLAVPA